MTKYELVTIVRGTLGEDQCTSVINKYKEFLSKNEINVVAEEPWGIQKFAYKIKNTKRGYYFLFHVECSCNAYDIISKEVKVNDNIFRFLLVKVDEFDALPSVFKKNMSQEFKKYGDR